MRGLRASLPFARAFLISAYEEDFCLGDAHPQMANTLIGLFLLLRAQTVLLIDRFFLYKFSISIDLFTMICYTQNKQICTFGKVNFCRIRTRKMSKTKNRVFKQYPSEMENFIRLFIHFLLLLISFSSFTKHQEKRDRA